MGPVGNAGIACAYRVRPRTDNNPIDCKEYLLRIARRI
jgi:hypothetical protein